MSVEPAGASRVGVGIVGAGFLARTRMRSYARVAGVDVRVVAVTSRTREAAVALAAGDSRIEVEHDLDALLARRDVDLVDLCVPNHLHRPFTERAARAGKHVACTKPLAAYVGQDLPEDAPDSAISSVPREAMRAHAVADAEAMVQVAREHGVQLMYGENWIYAPAIQRAARLARAARGALLEMRGWEGHSGSHSPYSKLWRTTGGGALLRLGAHPIGAMLYLKRLEGLARDGVAIVPTAVTADVADVSRAATTAAAPPDVATGWVDVENQGTAILAFSDGTRGIAHGSDTLLGGMQSRLDVFGSNFRVECNLSPHDLVRAYAVTPDVFDDEYVMEKAGTSAGWNTFLPDEDWSSGHVDMCRDFALAVAEGRPALSDGALGLAVTQVVYAAYVSAAEGRRVTL